ncbi:MAG: hypothetical protein NOI47_000363 [Candidatus Phytoplasma pruni]|nr:hypothetical protein [Candidatus Phytoplasma pruni]
MVYKKSLKHNSIIKYTRRLFLILFFLFLNTERTHLLNAYYSDQKDLKDVIINTKLGSIQCADPKQPTRNEILKAVHANNPNNPIDDIHIKVVFDALWPYKQASLFPSNPDPQNNPYKGQADLNYSTGFEPVDLSQVITSGNIGNVVCSDPKVPTKEEISNRITQKYNTFIPDEVNVVVDPQNPTTNAVAKANADSVSYNPGSEVDLTYKTVTKLPELSTIITSGEIGNVVCSDPQKPTKEEVLNQITQKYNNVFKEDVEVVLDPKNYTTKAVVKTKPDSNNYNPGSSVNLTYKTVYNSPQENISDSNWLTEIWFWVLTMVVAVSGASAYGITTKIKKKKNSHHHK